MSKKESLQGNCEQDLTTLEMETAEEQDLELENTDVGFLLDADGNLKTIFGPESSFTEPNDIVAGIMRILGIDEFTSPNRTLH